MTRSLLCLMALLTVTACAGTAPSQEAYYLDVTMMPPPMTALDVANGQVAIEATYLSNKTNAHQTVKFRLPATRQALHFPADFTLDLSNFGSGSLGLRAKVLDATDNDVACSDNGMNFDIQPAIFSCNGNICEGNVGFTVTLRSSCGW
jgi:hypothetical protein